MIEKTKILFFIRKDKKIALDKINKSINEWQKNRKKLIFFNNIHKLKLHWRPTGLFTNHFNIYLLWSNAEIKVLEEVNRTNVLKALLGLKNFYSKISGLKPDLTHPDILSCYNETARQNKIKTKKKILKEKIDVDILDPFGNVYGKNKEKIEKSLTQKKNDALTKINKSLEIFDKQYDILDKPNRLEKFGIQNIKFNKDKSFKISLIWNNKEVEFLNVSSKEEIKDNLIKFRRKIQEFNVARPNLNDSLTRKIYFLSLNNKNDE